MRAFSEVLREYLNERDRQNSDYYDDRFFGDRHVGAAQMIDLADELDEMFDRLQNDVDRALLTGNE